MQTFMPFSSFSASIECLDNRRLGKQRVEARQILDILLGKNISKAWINHPAVRMWRGFEKALGLYYNLTLIEWSNRGFKNIKLQPTEASRTNYPIWMGCSKFHESHQSNLLRKNYEWYKSKGFQVTNTDLPYVWPV